MRPSLLRRFDSVSMTVEHRRYGRCLGRVSSVSILALCTATNAYADCPGVISGGSVTCTVDESETLDSILVVDTTSTSRATYTINNAGTLLPSRGAPSNNYGILLDIYGNNGTGSAPGGVNGGNLTINNTGTITMNGISNPATTAEIGGMRAWGQGGIGVEPDKNGTDGGTGGQGGTINVTNSGTITFDSSAGTGVGAEIFGIDLRSIGGSGGPENQGAGDQTGGKSGSGEAVTLVNDGAINLGSSSAPIDGANSGRAIIVVSEGATGSADNENGAGGVGGIVTITNSADLNVNYNEVGSGLYGVHGIFAKSQAGNGSKSFNNSDNGGNGAVAGELTVTNTGNITIAISGTAQSGESAGIKALSLGGTGGESSDKASGGVGGSASTNASGGAGVLTIDMQGGTISTSGEGVRGIVALSNGGAGGNGNGDSRSTGGAGGFGGQIQVNFTGSSQIDTQDAEAYGILAQSVGGIGGGNAGSAGAGGDAGAVGVFASSGASIETAGDYSVGITLHSLGGGGGTGEDFTGILAGSGGTGGSGGDASQATITTASTITTSGEHAHGLLGQSIGGGGGHGGISASLTVDLGGDGGGGGVAGRVEINNTGHITTTGAYSAGVLVQSISGGGGSAGTAGGIMSIGGSGGVAGNNSAVSYVTNSGDITTTGAAGYGIVVQSIGGGGGTGGGASGILAVGGSGSAAGTGGTAEVFAVGGTVQTAGDHAYGVVAQSVGGGGGNGGDATEVSVGVSIGIGGSSSGGGNGGTACVTNTYGACTADISDTGSAAPELANSTVLTTGDFAHGVIAQSVGGGGGNGGDFEGGSVGSIVAIQIGGASASGGAGGAAEVQFDGMQVGTTGENARGILLQSIGGGGGNGGNSTALNGLTPLAIQVGGAAGGGGTANNATMTLANTTVTTTGGNASGVLAQSIGGGGGTGGSATGFDASLGFTFDAAIGGNGGSGGSGATVSLGISDSCIATGVSSGACAADASATFLGLDAASSHALSLQSIGGGGGTGGSSIAVAATVAVPTGEGESIAASGTLAMGGTGGDGGSGHAASAILSGTAALVTGGDGSHGVLAQSIGGGGGDGGSASALSGTLGVSNTVSADVAIALGATGGFGGAGGQAAVTLEDSASIATWGENSNGIVAQSVGGGGGDGGIGNAKSDKIGRGINVGIDLGLGGRGGSGGTGGTVDVDLAKDSTINTYGSGSRGVVAQSIGGGGGTGQGGSFGLDSTGFSSAETEAIKETGTEAGPGSEGTEDGFGTLAFNAALSVNISFGAKTGDGNTGGAINLTTGGRIITVGDDADGVVIQSIGGGGGLAGSAGSNSTSTTGPYLPRAELAVNAALSADLAFGGTGGTGGHGGAVDLTHAGQISTSGNFAQGIVAQSIGGGGGAGGTATTGQGSQALQLNVSLGGTGGSGGDGGDVDVFFNDGTGIGTNVTTTGIQSHAVLLQSIGGGGGIGETAATVIDTSSIDTEDVIFSLGLSGGLSIGGGKGGDGGSAGDGGAVTLDPASFVTARTNGDDAYALMAQSIGGGGGAGGSAATIGSTDEEGNVIGYVDVDPDLDIDLNVDLDIEVGGGAGTSGDGGIVSVETAGTFSTTGDRAFGIVAQSIGGGGGVGAVSSAENRGAITIDGSAGASGQGGEVTVVLSSGRVQTSGDGAHGIIAQSIGGGGGIAGDLSGPTLDTSFEGSVSGGNTGNAAAVTITTDGEIQTTGDFAYGIIAQSIGGGGGLTGSNGVMHAGSAGGTDGFGGRINLTANSTVSATGANAVGIFAQSFGIENNQNITIVVNGDVTGGSGDGAAVFVADGLDNALTIASGASVSAGGTTANGDRGFAVLYKGASTVAIGDNMTVNNSGTLNGDVMFTSSDSDAAGTVNNLAGGVWNLDGMAAADVINGGDIAVSAAPVSAATARTTATAAAVVGNVARIEGDYVQTATGTLVLGADFSNGTADKLEIGGDAMLDGTLRLDPRTLSSKSNLTVLSVDGALSGSLQVEDTPTVDFGLTLAGNQASVSVLGTRFGSAFASLDSNQQNIGRHLDEIYRVGAPQFDAFLADLSTLSAGPGGEQAFALGLDSMSPSGAQGAVAAQSILAQGRMDGALFCPYGTALVSGDTGEGCTWFSIGGSSFEQDGIGGYDGTHYAISGGARAELAGDWVLGVALGYEQGSYNADNGLSGAEGDSGFLAASLGRSFGNFELTGAVTASIGSFDLTRSIAVPSYETTAFGKTTVNTFGGRLRGSYTFGTPDGFIRPALNLDVVRTTSSGFTETGAGIFNLQVDDQAQTSATVTPAVEFGRNMLLSGGMQMNLFGSIGYSISNVDDWTTVSRLDSAPAAAGVFTTTVPIADRLGRVSLGMALSRSERFEARIEYTGMMGSAYSNHGLSFGMTRRF